MKKTVLFLALLTFTISLTAQEKPPVIENDHAENPVCDTLRYNVTLNDWWMEGHTIKIASATSQNAYVDFNDSIITYCPDYYYRGVDSVSYRLIDMDNSLISDMGYLIVNVINNSIEEIDANTIRATFMAYGLHFWGGGNKLGFEVPKGSGKHSIFSFALWAGGLDENNELHLAAEEYRQAGTDYQSGPVSDLYDTAFSNQWNKAWKLDKDQIQYHKEHWWEAGYIPIEAIASWPAHGNITNGQAADLAPFNDVNNNSIYDPENGDFPAIPGNQALFFIFNDDKTHTESQGEKLGIEIHGMAYSFDCPHDSAFNNTVFLNYDIINRSDNDYHDFYVGDFIDFDLGNPWDDYVGCDTLLNSYFVYNGLAIDGPGTGNPHDYYGDHPPAQAVTFLNAELNSVVSFNNSGGLYGDPVIAPEYYNVIQGHWSDGSPINPADPSLKYSYPGDPAINGEDNETTHGNNPGDRRSTGASGPYILEQGDTVSLRMTFVFGRDYSGDNFTSVANMKERIEHIRFFYENDSTPCGTSWSGTKDLIVPKGLFSVYPNPAKNVLTVSSANAKVFNYGIYDIFGRTVKREESIGKHFPIDISKLNKGIYILKLRNKDETQIVKFIKE